ncbi:MAG: hypothetical protein QNJ57_05535 [Flavobacteriaceae bacterium]|nr:hypothetical protein [Flavobacteriaceae bacterium]
MTIWNVIKRFNFKESWQLLVLSARYPLYIYPTLKATSQSYLHAKREYPKDHGKRGKANAFRHAFWNILICFECKKWNKNTRRILAWAKLITDKHEQLSPNEPIDEQMDLHNNKIGRNLFIASSFTSVKEMSDTIKYKMTDARQIKTVEDIQLYPTDLVYIKEE